MNKDDKRNVEHVLKRLFIGSQVDGIRFGVGPGSLLVYFCHYGSEKEPTLLWINIEIKKMKLFNKNDRKCGNIGLSELSDVEAIRLIAGIRREEVYNIWIGDQSPDLFLEFASGKLLWINGHHEEFECWQAGDGNGYTGEDWLIVAVPGDSVSIMAPNDFLEE